MTRYRLAWLLALAFGFLTRASARASVPVADPTRGVGFDQRLDAALPLTDSFLDESGHMVELGQYFQGKPVILVLTYYQCPMLCTEVLNELTRCLQEVSLDAGRDFQIAVISIDRRDTPMVARREHDKYAFRYSRPGDADGWHFLTGGNPRRVADAIGFRYRWDKALQEFVHASGIVVATPGGHVSQYFLGLKYDPEQVRKALVQAGAGSIGTPVERLLVLCYQYDPRTGKYGLIIFNVLRIGGVATVLALGMFMGGSIWWERRRAGGRKLDV